GHRIDLGRDADDHRLDAGAAQRLDVSEEPAAAHLLAELSERHAEAREEVLDHVAPGQQGNAADGRCAPLGPGGRHPPALLHTAPAPLPRRESSNSAASHTTGATAAQASVRSGPGRREKARSCDTAVHGVMKDAAPACGRVTMASSSDNAYPRRTCPHSSMIACSLGHRGRMTAWYGKRQRSFGELTSSAPPGRRTRSASASARRSSPTCSSTSKHVTASMLAVANGSIVVSPQ